jgi:uncharacterized protein YcfJ
MVVYRVAVRRLTLSVATAALLAGCAATPMGPTVQAMAGPGKTFDVFVTDNANCKNFAAQEVQGQADAANKRAMGTALLGTALGAATGAAGGALAGDAGGGAAFGAAAGAGAGSVIGGANNSDEQQGIQARYDNAYTQCMYAKGEQVPGYAPVPVAYAVPSSGPAADPLVRATQRELIRLGYLQGGADGFAGPRTRGAISSYEQANGMPVDGSASSRLLARLQGTPSGAATAAAAPAAAPAAWVAPTGSSGGAPATASAPAAPGGWVSPK